jgi:HD superfamily phosphohydrolase
MNMQYIDPIYGECEITEPVILELLESPIMQRLKGVDQAGYFEPFFSGTAHSRFEHSIGVYLLLRQFGTELTEQISGLIHDVSHSAFSHCADYIFAEGSQKDQSHQDNIFDTFVSNSEIPSILLKYGLDLDYILDDNNFPLKENNLPDICADRIDYSLRTTWHFRKYAPKQAKKIKNILANLTAKNGQWIFANYQSAKDFADLFFYANKYFYSGIESATMFRTTGDYLKHALRNSYISKADLYLTDSEVLLKIERYIEDDAVLKKLWKRMNGEIGCKNNPKDYDAQVFCKSRVVNPFCYDEGSIKRVSDIDPLWKKVIKKEMQPKEYFLKFSD